MTSDGDKIYTKNCDNKQGFLLTLLQDIFVADACGLGRGGGELRLWNSANVFVRGKGNTHRCFVHQKYILVTWLPYLTLAHVWILVWIWWPTTKQETKECPSIFRLRYYIPYLHAWSTQHKKVVRTRTFGYILISRHCKENNIVLRILRFMSKIS